MKKTKGNNFAEQKFANQKLCNTFYFVKLIILVRSKTKRKL